mmetsp:Transcript_58370/g.126246  ORF Transcript_58370/g.126246 Transcript_58370/m.126246 type:complete len:161 (-) Transcript_58370:2-484(-)
MSMYRLPGIDGILKPAAAGGFPACLGSNEGCGPLNAGGIEKPVEGVAVLYALASTEAGFALRKPCIGDAALTGDDTLNVDVGIDDCSVVTGAPSGTFLGAGMLRVIGWRPPNGATAGGPAVDVGGAHRGPVSIPSRPGEMGFDMLPVTGFYTHGWALPPA